MNTPVLPGEVVVEDGPANLQHGVETVGGALRLTNKRLIFEAQRFNVQGGATVLWLPAMARRGNLGATGSSRTAANRTQGRYG